MKTIQELQSQVENLNREIATLKEEELAKGNTTEGERQIASTLHKQICRGIHSADELCSCSWEYEKWDGETRQKYIEKARMVARYALEIRVAPIRLLEIILKVYNK